MAHLSKCVALFFLFFGLLQCYKSKLPKPIISPECELEGICESVENYPTNLVKGLIETLKRQNVTFNYDEPPQRRNDTSDEEHLKLCNSTIKFIPPKAAKDINGNWQYIINDSENPEQVIRIEVCRPPEGPCSDKLVFGQGYGGKCIQKKRLQAMFFVNETSGVGTAFVNVPTCCSCSLIRTEQ